MLDVLRICSESIEYKLYQYYFFIKNFGVGSPILLLLAYFTKALTFINVEKPHELSMRKCDEALKDLRVVNLDGFAILFDGTTYIPLVETFFKRQYTCFDHFKPKEGEVVVDIGASIGDYTLLASELVGEKGKVIAFEPNPHAYNLLLKNLELNNRENVLAHNFAVYSEDATIKIGAAKSSVMDSAFFVEGRDFYECKACRCDSISASVDLIKIDVEGSEVHVLKGAKGILSKFRPKIIVETHSGELKAQTMEFLEQFGYELMHNRMFGEGLEVLFFAANVSQHNDK